MNLIPRQSLFDMDNLFENFFAPRLDMGGNFFAPKIDLHEKGDSYEISAELPGVKKEDIHLTLNQGILSIEAEVRQENKEEKNGKVIRQERRYGKYSRAFDLGAGVQEGDIHARFEDGILTVSAPKKPAQELSSRKIAIK